MVDQTSQFYAILTDIGAAKQANADALGIPWTFTQMAVGDGNPTGLDNPPLPLPTATQPALLNEWRRAPLNQLTVDPNNAAVIIAEQVIPADVGGKWIREIALYDADGDMVAVANCPPTFKPLLSQGSGRTQVVRLNLIVSSSSNVLLKIDPSVVLATRAYVDNALLIHVQAANPHPQYQLRGAVTALQQTAAITATQMGLVLLDVSAGARTFTLPVANAEFGVNECVLRRIDVTTNALTIAAAGADKIMLDTSASPNGLATTELLFSGDYLRLRSDGAGKWWCVGQAPLPGDIATGLFVYKAAGAFTFSVPPVLRSGRRVAKFTVVGGGGGGAYGAGGGAGTAIKRQSLAGVPSVSVTVGAGGVGSMSAPGSGGASSFGAYCSATGGSSGSITGSASIGRAAAGDGVGGDINVLGGLGDAPSAGVASGGGSSSGVGGAGSTTTTAPPYAGQYGSGGGGSWAKWKHCPR
nr:phage tail protein [Pseudomonas sp. B14(2017)]